LKFAEAEHVRDIYPDKVRRADCHLVRERAVWRMLDNQAVRVGYRIFAGPDGKEPRIPGVTPRCEYGIEILVVLAFLVYLIGMSLDKACAVLSFFCQLPLAKSQADALLRQLATHWQDEFDTLCALLAEAAIVYMDETGWKVGNEKCSLWAFASKLHRVFLFGCHKDDATLDAMLPPDLFNGIGVSDDAGVYQNRFRRGQKCWAHLLRKAIKLALLNPNHSKYQRFLDELLAIYRAGKRSAADGRLGEAGRKQRVAELEGRLCELLQPHVRRATASLAPHECDFTNLVNELGRLVMAEELFTFVLEPELEATNNVSERNLRNPAQDRKAGRTNKTAKGAQRRSVIVSVLQSLRANLANFSLTTVLAEIGRWMQEGLSIFSEQWQTVQAAKAAAEAARGPSG
jgi:transposase